MSEEEKEAIKIVEDIAFVRGIRQDVEGELEDLGAIEDVLRLIDKLQKELKVTRQMNSNLTETLSESISKDIVRNKIKQLEDIGKVREYVSFDGFVETEYVMQDEIDLLKELLGE